MTNLTALLLTTRDLMIDDIMRMAKVPSEFTLYKSGLENEPCRGVS